MIYYSHENMMNVRVFDEARRMNNFEQIFEILNHLHAKKIMHRDLKSKNFLIELESYFKIVIIDFDLVNVVIDNA